MIKNVCAAVFLFVFVTFAVTGDASNTSNRAQGFKVFCDSQAKFDLVLKLQSRPGYDFLTTRRNEPLEVLVAGSEVQRFKDVLTDSGIGYEVFVEDVDKAVRDSLRQQKSARIALRDAPDSISLKHFPRYSEIKYYLKSLAKSRNDIASLFSIGKSYEGREIFGLKISSGGQGKPVLFIDAGIHAREWIAPSTAVYIVKQLVEDPANSHLFKNIDIYVIPSLNPDGYEYSHQNESTRMWRKTRSWVAGSNCRGADPNRNFDIAWMSHGGSSDPCSDTFAGSTPFSEPETAALRDFILARKEDIKLYLTLHSYGSYFLHPWGHTQELPKNEPLLRCVAEKAITELAKVRGTQYITGSSANVNAFTAGNSKDWVMGKAGVRVSYTMELPRGYGFLHPPSEIIPTGRETFEAIKVLVSYVEGKICQQPNHYSHI